MDGFNMHVVLPSDVDYFFYAVVPGVAVHVKGNSVDLSYVKDGDRIKIVAYAMGGSRFENFGVCMFTVIRNNNSTATKNFLKLCIPTSTRKTDVRSNTVSVSNGLVVDELEMCTRNLKRGYDNGGSHYQNQCQSKYIGWQWPWFVPGALGVPDIISTIPNYKRILPWVKWHGLSVYGKESYDKCTPSELLDVLTATLGAVGYLHGYDTEAVDDRAMPWTKFGTGSDCDDMSVAVAAFCNTLLLPTESCELGKLMKELFSDVSLVTGDARPLVNGNTSVILHMWVRLKFRRTYHDLYKEGDHLIVESTGAVSHYGTTPIVGNAVPSYSVVRSGLLNEYINERAVQTEDAMYIDERRSLFDDMDGLRNYMKNWYMEPPLYDYSRKFQPPPVDKKIVAYSTTRCANTVPSDAIVYKLFPFSYYDNIWVCK